MEIENPIYIDKIIELPESEIHKHAYDILMPTEVRVEERQSTREVIVNEKNIIETP